MSTEKTFTVVGTAANADGTTKVRWANDFASRVKILDKAGCTNINLIELPTGMTKLEAMKFLVENVELDDAAAEVVALKIDEKERAEKRAKVKATITKNVETKAKDKKSDPRVTKLVKEAQAADAE